MGGLNGINLAMQTPFDEDGAIDWVIYEELIDRYIDAGVHGLVLGAGTGQHPFLTEAECNALYEVGAKRIGGRCNLICQTSALNVDEVIRRSKHAESVGAQALMVLPPYLEGPADDDGLFEFYRVIDAAIGIDIVGYNIPQATGISVSLDLLRRLMELRNFNYIKDSAGDMTTHQEYLQVTSGVLSGADPTTIFALMAGTTGVIWGGANYMPKEAVQLYEHVARQELSAAMTLWARMIPSLLFIWRAKYTQSVVRAAHLRGYGTGNVRRPLLRLTPEEDKALQGALAALEA